MDAEQLLKEMVQASPMLADARVMCVGLDRALAMLARPATPRDESRVLQPTTASASRLIDPEQKFEVKPKQRGRPDAAMNPGRRAIPAWRAPLHK